MRADITQSNLYLILAGKVAAVATFIADDEHISPIDALSGFYKILALRPCCPLSGFPVIPIIPIPHPSRPAALSGPGAELFRGRGMQKCILDMRILNGITTFALLAAIITSCEQTQIIADTAIVGRSPDGALALTFGLSGKGEPVYALSYKDQDIVLPSRMGFSLINGQEVYIRKAK